jgi:hypothetical protein
MADADYEAAAGARAARHEAGHAVAYWLLTARSAEPFFTRIRIGASLDNAGTMASDVDMASGLYDALAPHDHVAVLIAGFVAQDFMLTSDDAGWEQVRDGMGDGDTAMDYNRIWDVVDTATDGRTFDDLIKQAFDALWNVREEFLSGVSGVASRLSTGATMNFSEFLDAVNEPPIEE